MDVHDLLQNYQHGPGMLSAALEGVEESWLDQTPVPERWSIRQVVCHLADAEIVYADRLKRVVIEDNPTLFDWAPDTSVLDVYCRTRRPMDELNLIKAVRQHVTGWLSSLDIEVWQRTAVHSTDGPMTLETLLERITEHIPHHIHFIKQKQTALESG